MPGFSTQEQLFLAALIGNHRGVVANGFTERLPTRLHEPLRVTLFCLRFASILCRSREDTAVPKFTLAAQDHSFAIGFTGKWAREHPLTVADLEGEVEMLRKIGLRLKFSYHPTSQPA
jgi:exopolyphosphatase/guanosine-5'-triphosphate,3'-diphosphate pyrophosphatase